MADIQEPTIAKTALPEPARRKTLVNERDLTKLFPGVLSLPTLRSWRFKRVGPPYYKILNRKILYSPEEVQAWLESTRIDPEAL